MLVAGKDAKIAALEERVARLERLISRNSGNSSMPPGTDDLPGKKPPERRPRRGGLIDVFCMAGTELYRAILHDVGQVHRRIPRERMRYALDTP